MRPGGQEILLRIGWLPVVVGCGGDHRGDTGAHECEPDETYVLGDRDESEWPEGENYGVADVLADYAEAQGAWTVTLDCGEDAGSSSGTVSFSGDVDPSDCEVNVYEPVCGITDSDLSVECRGEAGVFVELNLPDRGDWSGDGGWVEISRSGVGTLSPWGIVWEATDGLVVKIEGNAHLTGAPTSGKITELPDDDSPYGFTNCMLTVDGPAEGEARRRWGPTLPAEPPTCPAPASR